MDITIDQFGNVISGGTMEIDFTFTVEELSAS